VALTRCNRPAAAIMLGDSRRQIENFLSGGKPIPRVCVLACWALEWGKRINA
jgi:hypothetical protein